MAKFSIYDGEKRIYFNSDDEYNEYLRNNHSSLENEPTFLGLCIFFVASWLLTSNLFLAFYNEAGKNIKFAVNLIFASGLAFIGYKYGRKIFQFIFTVIAVIFGLCIIFLIGRYLYSIA